MQPTEPSHEHQGELVTRADGSRAIRVRKQRPRSPSKQLQGAELRRHRTRVRLIAAGVALVMLALAALAAVLYPKSSSYRGKLGDLAANSTGAKVTLRNVSISPGRATADQVDLVWPDGNPLASLEVEGIFATVSTLRAFRRSFGGEEIRGKHGNLILRKPVAGVPATRPSDERGRVYFERIGVASLDVFFGDPAVAGVVALTGTEAALYPSGPKGFARLLLHSGALQIPFWPEVLLERALVEFHVGQAEIVSMRLRHAQDPENEVLAPGICDIAGVIRQDMAETSTLSLQFDAYQLNALIGDELARLLSGRVDTKPGSIESMFRIPPDALPTLRAELVANPNSQIVFSGFPFLAFFSTAFEDTWFLNPSFEAAASLTLVREGAEVRIENLDFARPGRMALRGALVIDSDDEIAGILEVGIAPEMIEYTTARRLDGMFSAPRSGFRWITLQLGGVPRMPTDNFNALFIDTPMPPPARDTSPPGDANASQDD